MAAKKKPAMPPKTALVAVNSKKQELTVLEERKDEVKTEVALMNAAVEECNADPRLKIVMEQTHAALLAAETALPARMYMLGMYIVTCEEDPENPIANAGVKISKTIDKMRRPYIGKAMTFYSWLDGVTADEKKEALARLLSRKSKKLGAGLTWPHFERLIPIKEWKRVLLTVDKIMDGDWTVHELAYYLNGGQAKKTTKPESKGPGGRPRVRVTSDTGRLLKFEKDVDIFRANADIQWFDKDFGFRKIAEQTPADAVTPVLIGIYEKNLEKNRQMEELVETAKEELQASLTILRNKMALQAKLLGVKDAEVLETKQLTHKPEPAAEKELESVPPDNEDELTELDPFA